MYSTVRGSRHLHKQGLEDQSQSQLTGRGQIFNANFFRDLFCRLGRKEIKKVKGEKKKRVAGLFVSPRGEGGEDDGLELEYRAVGGGGVPHLISCPNCPPFCFILLWPSFSKEVGEREEMTDMGSQNRIRRRRRRQQEKSWSKKAKELFLPFE